MEVGLTDYVLSCFVCEGHSPSALFGANLIGAMIGGFCEYLSLVTGNGSLMLLVIAAYLVSLGLRARLRALQIYRHNSGNV